MRGGCFASRLTLKSDTTAGFTSERRLTWPPQIWYFLKACLLLEPKLPLLGKPPLPGKHRRLARDRPIGCAVPRPGAAAVGPGEVEAFDPEIAPYAKYALANHGKQLRAALTGLAANCVGGWNDSAAKAAVIIEMVPLAKTAARRHHGRCRVAASRPTLANKWDKPRRYLGATACSRMR
ncbi:MAG: hypothetical protein Ct9H300mP32_2400 [Verrucomicrobiota bacterium]|nr:MAG: hypothetical protein Ct9H300mP32_2400 [Verrucomicrobiota bacterium]